MIAEMKNPIASRKINVGTYLRIKIKKIDVVSIPGREKAEERTENYFFFRKITFLKPQGM